MTTTNGEVKDAPRTVRATVDELKTTFYDTPNLQAALEALHQDGFVVLKSIVDVNHIDQINSYMSKEADELVKNETKPFNQGVNSNILQAPPLLQEEYLHNDVFFNPFVIQVMNAHPIWNFVTGNNALPKTHGLRQPIHKDITFNHPQCPFYVIANIPLCPFNVSTGSTEFWLGSHAHTSGADQIPATSESKLANARLVVGDPTCNVKLNIVEERRRVRPPIQPVCERGDVMLRDLRTWHAGMPNEGEDYRIMIALGYQVCSDFIDHYTHDYFNLFNESYWLKASVLETNKKNHRHNGTLTIHFVPNYLLVEAIFL
ncbi:hypothetical protein MFRU_025g00080 [Monilinia fructicola]|nr:hypothetical protein MFRU_025g00080 [Monilinia fructicola]